MDGRQGIEEEASRRGEAMQTDGMKVSRGERGRPAIASGKLIGIGWEAISNEFTLFSYFIILSIKNDSYDSYILVNQLKLKGGKRMKE